MAFLILFITGTFFSGSIVPDLHPIHLSVTEIYRNDMGALEMSVTFFMDDFSNAVNYDRYRDKIDAGELTVDDLIMTYLRKHHQLKMDGEPVSYQLKRKQSNFPALTCYFLIDSEKKNASSLTVRNTMMLELFDDQRNMVNVRLSEKKVALLLHKKQKEATASF
ncbi:MAG: hypothetical protein HRU40_09370 [Saprospiraceae bacterium]|nr:hypothetical protein [Saprospiraceae bacterium]